MEAVVTGGRRDGGIAESCDDGRRWLTKVEKICYLLSFFGLGAKYP